MQFTIESRQLTSETTRRPAFDVAPKHTQIEAGSADDAIGQFLRGSELELISVSGPVRGGESIATVRKDDSVYLVRIYAS